MNNLCTYICIVLCTVLIFASISPINAEQTKIPNWIRTDAKWWQQGQVQDSEFINAIEYLIEKKIMIIPSAGDRLNNGNKIPSWIKNNAGWWANGTISDNDFIFGIHYLVRSGIIAIKPNENQTQSNSDERCNQYATAAEKETCLEQIGYDAKIQNSIKTSTPYVIGPIIFYYVNSESQK